MIPTKKDTNYVSDEFKTEEKRISAKMNSPLKNMKYLWVGLVLGMTFVKGEVINWFRIQEMFHFGSFHLYGIIGTAVLVGVLPVFIIKRFRIKTLQGEEIQIEPKKFNKGQIYGGLLFGCGWALTGACPGPLFAQIASGSTVVIVTFLSAASGTWVYAYFQHKLPH